MYEPYMRSVAGKDRKYVSLGDADGGNYRVFTWDYDKRDPVVHMCDSDLWDVEAEVPTESTPLATLSSFVAMLREE